MTKEPFWPWDEGYGDIPDPDDEVLVSGTRWPDCATGWHDRCPVTRPGIRQSCGCPCHTRTKVTGGVSPTAEARGWAEVAAKIETLAALYCVDLPHRYDPDTCRCICGALDHPDWGVTA